MNSRIVTVGVLGPMLISLGTFACSSDYTGFQPTNDESSESETSTFVEPERYTLQQALNTTMTLTTTSVGGTFGRLDKKHPLIVALHHSLHFQSQV